MPTKTLKQQINLATLIAETVTLKPTGRDLIGRCPFHDDRTPSLVVTPSKGLWHCMGACNTGGSAIDWIVKRDGVTVGAAITYLEKHHMQNNGIHPNLQTAQALMDEQTLTEPERQKLLNRCLDYFQRRLKQTPEALSYLAGRGLEHKDLLETFQLGFADNSFLDKLPPGKDGTELRRLLKQTGILTQTGRLHFNGCIVIPIKDADGLVKNIYGRTLKEKKNTPTHIYLPGAQAGIFNYKALLSAELILTESIFDALSFWVHGFYNVTCSYGTNGFTDELREAITTGNIERVFIAYDNDTAGNKAAAALAESLSTSVECRRVLFPEGLDANEYIQQVKAPGESLKLLLQSALPVGETAKVPAKGEKVLFSDLVQSAGRASDQLEKKDGAFFYLAGDRRYKAVGLEKNLSPDSMKLYLKVESGKKFHMDNSVDLFAAKDRRGFVRQAAEELELDLEVIKKDVAKLLPLLEEKQTELIRESKKDKAKEERLMSEPERLEAVDYLKDPKLVENILTDFKSLGLVGEDDNALVGYLAATSRKEDRPLAIIIQSSSGAGKSTLMDAILDFMPEEDVTRFSAMTGQSLYYMDNSNLSHKILAIVEEEGAERASYSLKLLQSEGKISIASTGKDPDSGRMVTHEYTVEGPIMLIVTTTKLSIDEELTNRSAVLTVNEDRDQTRRIHRLQREGETLSGILQTLDREALINKHRNVQRLLRPLRIHNPYAKQLTFNDTNHRARRDQLKYLTLIRTVTLIHQYQREIKTATKAGRTVEYIETTLGDIALANRLAGHIFKATLDDLPPQSRVVLDRIYDFVRSECSKRKIEQEDFRFSRRDLRECLSLGNTQLVVHLERLVDYEYIIVHRGRRGQSFVYELTYQGPQDNELAALLNLADPARLKQRKKSRV